MVSPRSGEQHLARARDAHRAARRSRARSRRRRAPRPRRYSPSVSGNLPTMAYVVAAARRPIEASDSVRRDDRPGRADRRSDPARRVASSDVARRSSPRRRPQSVVAVEERLEDGEVVGRERSGSRRRRTARISRAASPRSRGTGVSTTNRSTGVSSPEHDAPGRRGRSRSTSSGVRLRPRSASVREHRSSSRWSADERRRHRCRGCRGARRCATPSASAPPNASRRVRASAERRSSSGECLRRRASSIGRRRRVGSWRRAARRSRPRCSARSSTSTTAGDRADSCDRDGQVRLHWGVTPVDLFFAYDDSTSTPRTTGSPVPFGDETIVVLAPEDLLVCKAVLQPAQGLDRHRADAVADRRRRSISTTSGGGSSRSSGDDDRDPITRSNGLVLERARRSVDADVGVEAHRRGVGPAGRDEHELQRVAGDLGPAAARRRGGRRRRARASPGPSPSSVSCAARYAIVASRPSPRSDSRPIAARMSSACT